VTDAAGIGENVRTLLTEYVGTYDELEALLLLHRSRDRAWTPAEICEQLNLSPSLVDEALAELVSHGLLTRGESAAGAVFSYAPSRETLGQAVDQLALAYEDRRIEVIRLMSRNAINRVRTQAIRAFADAFIVKKKK